MHNHYALLSHMDKIIKVNKKDATDFFGNDADLARAIGVNRQAVHQWADEVPEVSAWRIWFLSKGKVKAEFNSPLKWDWWRK